jgi:PRC-barrel domain
MTRNIRIGLTAAILATLLFAAGVSRLPSRQPELVSADVAEVKKGYRSAWLLGHSVINDQNERIGTIADLVLGQDYALFAVLEVGGFLGLRGHLVAVPIRALLFEGDSRKVVLPGATRKALRNFPEFKFDA